MVLHKLQSILSHEHYWDWHKMSVLWTGVNLIVKKFTWKNSRNQLDFVEVPLPFDCTYLCLHFLSLMVTIFLAFFLSLSIV